jgi:hypothetical protein
MGCSLPDSSRNVASRGTEYLVPSLKMFPISITRSIRSDAPAPRAGLAVRHLADVGELRLEVAAGLDPQQV